MTDDLTEVDDYEKFLERLRSDLVSLQKKKEAMLQKVAEFDQFMNSLKLLRSQDMSSFIGQAPLGSGVSVEAVVPDTSEVFVHIGMGYHVACTHAEALEKVTLRKAICESQLSELLPRIGELHASITFMIQGMETLNRVSEQGDLKSNEQ